MQPRGAAASSYVRYFHHGGTLSRDGVLLPLGDGTIEGADVLAALRADGVDLDRFAARAYDPALRGWVELTEATSFVPETVGDGRERIDVKLFPPPVEEEEEGRAPPAGYFTCGVVGLKNELNLGTLWRSAYQLGAAALFVVGTRVGGSVDAIQSSDTSKAWRSVPFVQHDDWNAFAAAAPRGALWVAIEMGGEPLETFEHPERAVYVLGSEDSGLPESVVRACHRHVALPASRSASYNVAVAGSIVMYDRLAKEAGREREAAGEVRPNGNQGRRRARG